MPSPTAANLTNAAGVDLSLRYLAVTTNTTGKSAFYSGKEVRQKANHLARVRKRLQQKGTRAATRRLVAIGQRKQAMLAYKATLKATLAGSQVVWVDAHYTSQRCPRCGHTSHANRPHKGLLFVCAMCGYTLHADLIGARNVALRTLLIRQDWMSTGALSVRPDASDVEAKATRLSRCAELRWSPEASPRVYKWGH